MKKHFLIGFIILISLLLLISEGLFAGAANSGITELQMPSGQNGTTGQGDYVSSTGGLNTYLSYFIEVPPGSTTLIVDLYDADVGNLVPSDIGDRLRTAYNTSVTYTLLRPDGTTEFTYSCAAGVADAICGNGVWTTFRTVASPAAGHWELRVDMGAGDDLNGFAIRAYDPAPLGKEYNIYADSFIDIGVHAAGGSSDYTNIFPFVTSGCDFSTRDWDMDGSGSISVTSRTGGAFTQTNSAVSGSTAWLTTTVPETGSGWTTDETAGDYGIWSSNMTVSAGANYTTIYLGQYNAVATPPTSQPQANTFRMYFLGKDLTGVNTAVSATKLVDALANFLNPAALAVRTGDIVKNISAGTYTTVTSIDSATQLGLAADIFTTTSQNYSIVSVSPPVKPYLTQILASPIPAVISGKTTRVNIQVTITNPTPFDITFSATNLVTANVPGPTCPAATDSACYAGSSYASVTQGVITGQPAAGGQGT